MTEKELQAKLQQWLRIKGEADSIEKNLQKSSGTNLFASEKLDKNDYLKNMLKQVRQMKKLPETPKAGNTLDYSKMKPAPSQSGIVQGQRMHPRSVSSNGVKSNKLFDPRLSGIVKKAMKKSVQPQPAAVSEPQIVTTRGIVDNPKEIQSPMTVNGYGLKGKK